MNNIKIIFSKFFFICEYNFVENNTLDLGNSCFYARCDCVNA